MAPETPRPEDRLQEWFSGLPGPLRQALEMVQGTSADSAWLRLALGAVLLPLVYLGLKIMIGDLPNMLDNLFKGFENLGRLFDLFLRLFFPAQVAETVPKAPDIYAQLPKVGPQASLLDSLGLLFKQIDGDNLQGAIVFFLIPLIWALGRAVYIFEETYRLHSFRAVAENLAAAYFPPFRRKMVVRDSSLVMDTTTIHPRRVGGPLRLEVDRDSLAVMEQRDGAVRMITATSRPVDINAFERLHRVLDLRPQTLVLTQALLTRDGVPVVLRRARFTCCVRRSENGVDLGAAHNLVYRHWLGKSWEDPEARQRDTRRLVERELAQFVSREVDLDDLVQYWVPPPVLKAFPVERQALQEFVAYFNSRSEHGLQLTWSGEGQWEPPESLVSPELTPTLEACVQDQSLRIRLARIIPRQYTEQEICRLAGEVVQQYDVLNAQKADEETIVRQLVAVYTRILKDWVADTV